MSKQVQKHWLYTFDSFSQASFFHVKFFLKCQKVCKQGRDDIEVKVNIQSPIPASFHTRVYSCSPILDCNYDLI